MLFIDRADAGRHLAQRMRHLRGADVAVLGLPRGGVLVAFEVAEELRAPLDVIVVRKLDVPFQPEYCRPRTARVRWPSRWTCGPTKPSRSTATDEPNASRSRRTGRSGT